MRTYGSIRRLIASFSRNSARSGCIPHGRPIVRPSFVARTLICWACHLRPKKSTRLFEIPRRTHFPILLTVYWRALITANGGDGTGWTSLGLVRVPVHTTQKTTFKRTHIDTAMPLSMLSMKTCLTTNSSDTRLPALQKIPPPSDRTWACFFILERI